jgi:hypothetical protein
MNRFILCLSLGALATASFATADKDATPVVVELFTSQGCSSCPPADAFLKELANQPVNGVEIIPVSWHVDYWNRLGWTDPFSSNTATNRQNAYAKQLNAQGLYTPQMVVDGQAEFVGSDRRRGLAAIESAAAKAKVPLELSVTKDGDRVAISAMAGNVEKDWRATALLTQDNIETAVKRGENGGRTLQHTGVVRASGLMANNESGVWQQTLDMPDDAGKLNVVVYVQNDSGQIVAANAQSISN